MNTSTQLLAVVVVLEVLAGCAQMGPSPGVSTPDTPIYEDALGD